MKSLHQLQWRTESKMPLWVFWVNALVATIVVGPALMYASIALPGQPGMADLPGTVNYHWLIQSQGIASATESSLLMHPALLNRFVLDGAPLDALASWPFTALLGWPGGFTAFVWASLLALGMATAWLAHGWWGTPMAAAVAGVVAQTHPFLIRELSFGRPTQVFGALFLPLAMGFAFKSLNSGRRIDGYAAGIAWGLGTLSYWFYGVYFGVGLAILLLAARPDLSALRTACGRMIAGLALVTAGPLYAALTSDGSIPGQGLGLNDTVTHGDNELTLRALIEFRDLGESILSERVLAAQVLVVFLVVWAVRNAPRTLWLTPLLWVASACWFAAGPAINLPGGIDLAGPFMVFDLSDLTRRNWWPDRALVLAVPATALLAAGGANALISAHRPLRTRLATLLACGALVTEAFLVIPGLPMGTTWGAESPKTRQLAIESSPTLILPLSTEGGQPDARMMIDQIHHGRALVNGPMPYTSSTAPAAYREAIETVALAGLVACERGEQPAANPSLVWEGLAQWSVTTVYLDLDLAGKLAQGPERYRACVERVLGPANGGEPMLEYRR